jgi:hypothetical protein
METAARHDYQLPVRNPGNQPACAGISARPPRAARTRQQAQISDHEPGEVPVTDPAGLAGLQDYDPEEMTP